MQYDGTAANGCPPKNQDKTLFVQPAIGKEMGRFSFKLNGDTRYDEITYMVHPPAWFLDGIVFSSLEGRMKPSKKKNNINWGAAEHYPNNIVKYVPKMRTRTKKPNNNVVLCWIDFRQGRTEFVVQG